jgi:DNA-binding NarL/FixJ family response regulator
MEAHAGAPRAVIIDDEPLARTALKRFLTDAGIAVVGVGVDAQAGIEAVIATAPDVALVDLGLPDMPGVEATSRIAALSPATKVLVVTASDAQDDVIDAMRAGATGYLLKDASADEIAAATRAVAGGEPVLSGQIASRLITLACESPRHANSNGLVDADADLTPRELEILRMLAEGKDNAEIAAELNVSPFTVKNHVANILGKLHMHNRIQAAVHAVRVGIA